MSALWTQAVPAARERTLPGGGATIRPPRILLATGGVTGQDRGSRYERVPVPSIVVYEIRVGEHRQTGVVVEVSVEDYRRGRVLAHEATEPERERRLAKQLEATGTQQTPVLLVHRSSPALAALLAEAAAGDPSACVDGDSGVTHTAWVAGDDEIASGVQRELDVLGSLYIVDGHHRMAAVERHDEKRARNGRGSGCAGYALAALFPSEQVRIHGYGRYVRRPPGRSWHDLLTEVSARPAVARIERLNDAETATPSPGAVAMCAGGAWYRLWLARQQEVPVRRSLDVVALDEEVLAPAFGAAGGPGYAAIAPSQGRDDPSGLARWCERHDAMGFLPAPPGIDQVMAVSEEGSLLPPKSTWFSPKAGNDLFRRELEQP